MGRTESGSRAPQRPRGPGLFFDFREANRLLKNAILKIQIIRKHWQGLLLSAVLLLTAGAVAMVAWAGSQIASPSRRPLMNYHQEFLANPGNHGFQIARFNTSDGTPCLVCTPVRSLGERGTLIRKQLGERGLSLKPAGETIGTLVLVHGRRGRKEDYLPIAERLCAVGFRCVIPDLPAHGDHPVAIATYGVNEATLPARVLNEAALKYAFDPAPAGLLGMSMGGSVAVHASALPDAPWKALAVISSFDSFPRVIAGQATRHVGSALGPLWASASNLVYQMRTGISIHDIQPCLHAASLHLPTLIAHGTDDPVIEIDSGKCLYNSLPAGTAKKWLVIPGAAHDNVLITSYPIYAEIAEWMLRNVTP
jgi:uncharacterized protein